ncbi:SpoIID/LytB domain-containing protein [Alkalinema sp. FACHB-956]|nr:SpoIID/LytB domain-containing protein [Alkalinema sp. FACHB-956]
MDPAVPQPQAAEPCSADYEALVQELTQPTPATPTPSAKQLLRQWVHQHPWIFLPLLGIFPAIAWGLDQHRPPTPPQSTLVNPPSLPASPIPTPASQIPNSTAATTAAKPTASPSPTPVDLSKLTPEQKEMNRRAKALFEATNAPVDAYIEMHVGIAKGNAIVIASSTNGIVSNDKGEKIATMTAGEVYTAQFDGQGISLGSSKLPLGAFITPEPGGLLYVNNRAYRGKLLLAIHQGQLQAVNYVNMRQYLYSVVASEVSPSWSPEALKAQAVAARSYAMTYYFKPAHPLYHLGNDEYFQVYSGIEKEDDRTNQAVDMTSGEYVSYKGGIVESLYAASDDIVAEAFAGKGMSQLGALNLAEQGYKYVQILGSYYPGTKVAKIAKDY